MKIYTCAAILVSTTIISTTAFRLYFNDVMKCSYGERGSLTATCYNATPSYFKSTPYRFDHLDETLRCVNCSLQTLESATFDITGNQIKNLNLSSCRIETIKSRAFVGLIFLEVLDLSHNNIRQITAGTFSAVKKIRNINLSNNLIAALTEDGFAELIDLAYLNLRNNSIKMIVPKAFNGLSNLVWLDLGYNKLNSLPESIFDELSSLVVLTLTSNNISVLYGTEFYNLSKLETLTLSSNKISIPQIEMTMGNNLKIISLTNNQITAVQPKVFTGLTALRHLDMSHNAITDLFSKSFSSMYALESLDLSYNNLPKFHTNWFSGLPELQDLNVSHNVINSLEILGVFTISNLHTLDLSYNNLSDLDYAALISRLPKLSYLRLEDNSLSCELEDEMSTYFEQDNFKYVLFDHTSDHISCVLNWDSSAPKKHYESLNDLYVSDESRKAITASEIWLLVFICLGIVMVAIVAYLQYVVYTKHCNDINVTSEQLIPTNESLVESSDM